MWSNGSHVFIFPVPGLSVKEMIFDLSRSYTVTSDVLIDRKPIEKFERFKYFGPIFSDNLKWSDYSDYIFHKLKSIFYVFSKFKTFPPSSHHSEHFMQLLILPILRIALTPVPLKKGLYYWLLFLKPITVIFQSSYVIEFFVLQYHLIMKRIIILMNIMYQAGETFWRWNVTLLSCLPAVYFILFPITCMCAPLVRWPTFFPSLPHGLLCV